MNQQSVKLTATFSESFQAFRIFSKQIESYPVVKYGILIQSFKVALYHLNQHSIFIL